MENGKRKATTAERLKEALAESGKRQADLARETGVDKGALSSYLSGKYEPKQKTIGKLAVALNVSELWLWGYDIPKERTQAQKKNDTLADIVIRMRSDEDFLSIVEKLNKLDADQLKSVEGLLVAFLK